VVLGKILPYLALAFVQLLLVLGLMRWVFRVPIHGSIPLLLGLAVIYLFALRRRRQGGGGRTDEAA
jgi:ABC-2 type transport system permease protein